MLRLASRYLNPNKFTDRKTLSFSETEVRKLTEEAEVIRAQLRQEGRLVERPRYRTECPTFRPCPFVGCRYHLWGDITKNGTLKVNFYPMEPWDLSKTCALDVVEDSPGGCTLQEVGEMMQLTRERVRQIEKDGLKKLSEIIPIEDFLDKEQ